MNICVFTATRAEYGILRELIRLLMDDHDFDVKLVISGTHVALSYGCTERQIIADGFSDFDRVEILLDGTSDTAVCAGMAIGMLRYGDLLSRHKPDLLLVLGDRFEVLTIVTCAAVCRIPVAHIHGGEITLGAIDDAFRHAVTKMSHLHFTSTDRHRHRVVQMGESEERVFNVGALGVEDIRQKAKFTRREVENHLGIAFEQPYLLATYHPVTRDKGEPEANLEPFIEALARFPRHVIILTGSNADRGGALFNKIYETVAAESKGRFRYFVSLGVDLYLSVAQYADAVVGNSSSGIIEVPSLGTPVVDIGRRQEGRDRSKAVIWCNDAVSEIEAAINMALTPERKQVALNSPNPYERAGTARTIVETLRNFKNIDLLTKYFNDDPFTKLYSEIE